MNKASAINAAAAKTTFMQMHLFSLTFKLLYLLCYNSLPCKLLYLLSYTDYYIEEKINSVLRKWGNELRFDKEERL
jgi:hypothetical protein